MGGIRNRVRVPSLVLDSQANGNGTSQSSVVDNMTGLRSQAFSRANSLDSCNAMPCLSKQVAITKVSEMNSRLGRVGSAWLERAVEILDTVGSSMTNLNNSNSFTTSATIKENKISILAFEVGNTIIKGAKLMESLSEDNIKDLKMVKLRSKGVRMLVKEDMDELLKIVEADKREELAKFSREVARLGNHCKDPQWHNLDRYFEKLAADHAKYKCSNAETTIKELMALVNHTAELFKALKVLNKVEEDYAEKLKEDSKNMARRGDIPILEAELQTQQKLVISLKKISLWSKNFEEVIESLVDIVHFLHLKIHDAFGSAGMHQTSFRNLDCFEPSEDSRSNNNRLGPAGIALNYAHIIRQIDTLVSLSSSVPTNVKEDLYQRLPHDMKFALSTKLRSFQAKAKIPQVRAKMEKILRCIVPIAHNTTNDLQGFGWARELESLRSEVYQNPAGRTDILRIETLYHADKDKTEACIFQLLVWLHHLISQTRSDDEASSSRHSSSNLTFEDQEMLDDVGKKISTLGISKSQNFDASKTKLYKHHRLSKSSKESPTSETNNCSSIRWLSCSPVIDFDIDRIKALDVIDGLGTT